MDKMRVALLAGGLSGEREVSLRGAEAVAAALDPDKFVVRRFDPAHDLAALAATAGEIDFAFIVLHGVGGEDGTLQGMLDLLGIAYQGSGVLGSAVAMDKDLAKELYKIAGLPVADWLTLTPGQAEAADAEAIIARLGLPLVVKPVREGSSLGLSIARDKAALIAGIDRAGGGGRAGAKRAVMIERFIPGRELTVGVIGNDRLEALPVVEIVPGAQYEFFDYEAKYQPGASEEICPAPVSDEIRDQAQDYAMRAHQALRLSGYSRTDMRLDPDGNLYLLETNTIPGMTETSLLPRMAAAHGLSFARLLEKLIELGMERR